MQKITWLKIERVLMRKPNCNPWQITSVLSDPGMCENDQQHDIVTCTWHDGKHVTRCNACDTMWRTWLDVTHVTRCNARGEVQKTTLVWYRYRPGTYTARANRHAGLGCRTCTQCNHHINRQCDGIHTNPLHIAARLKLQCRSSSVLCRRLKC